MSDAYAHLNAEAALLLLSASSGRAHMQRAAAHILAQVGQDKANARSLFQLGRQVHFCALESDPLDAAAMSLVLSLDQQEEFLGASLRKELRHALKATRQPDDIRYFQRLAKQNRSAKLETYLSSMLEKEPANLFWLRHLHSLRMALGNFSGAMQLMASPLLKSLAQLRLRLSADILFQQKKYDRAAATLQNSLRETPWIQARLRLAEALHRSGDTSGAVATCASMVRDHPWHSNAALRLYEYCTPRPPAPLHGSLGVCLYTYNKADDLDRTLKALMASDLDGAVVRVLDNGCTDATSDLLQAWANRVPSERLDLVRLPVNIGAPAARNWLIHKNMESDTTWTAFLDDDALVPQDWLDGLGQAVAAYPEAGAWGCKVVDMDNPSFMQSVDLHLIPPSDAPEDQGLLFRTTRAHRHELDYGQFDYIRSCASVTGCLHLFRTATLARTGGFDIRFSPSQYDDLDHDIRLCEQSAPPAYTGFVRVRHAKSTGKLASISAQASASNQANNYKLHMKHPADTVGRIMRQDMEAMRADLQDKAQRIAPESAP
jgi:GT2 family glycosyltransferase